MRPLIGRPSTKRSQSASVGSSLTSSHHRDQQPVAGHAPWAASLATACSTNRRGRPVAVQARTAGWAIRLHQTSSAKPRAQVRVGLRQADQAVAGAFFRAYAGSGLVIQRWPASSDPQPRQVARIVSPLTRVAVSPSSCAVAAARSASRDWSGGRSRAGCGEAGRAAAPRRRRRRRRGRCGGARSRASARPPPVGEGVDRVAHRLVVAAERGGRWRARARRGHWPAGSGQRRKVKAWDERRPASRAWRSASVSGRTKRGSACHVMVTHGQLLVCTRTRRSARRRSTGSSSGQMLGCGVRADVDAAAGGEAFPGDKDRGVRRVAPGRGDGQDRTDGVVCSLVGLVGRAEAVGGSVRSAAKLPRVPLVRRAQQIRAAARGTDCRTARQDVADAGAWVVLVRRANTYMPLVAGSTWAALAVLAGTDATGPPRTAPMPTTTPTRKDKPTLPMTNTRPSASPVHRLSLLLGLPVPSGYVAPWIAPSRYCRSTDDRPRVVRSCCHSRKRGASPTSRERIEPAPDSGTCETDGLIRTNEATCRVGLRRMRATPPNGRAGSDGRDGATRKSAREAEGGAEGTGVRRGRARWRRGRRRCARGRRACRRSARRWVLTVWTLTKSRVGHLGVA